MKNSASNYSQIQVLQTQAEQLLPLVTNALAKFAYQEITHQRISQQNSAVIDHYQGLTRAQHRRSGQVIIKWQLNSKIEQNTADLQYEITVLIALNEWQEKHNNTIAPLLLDHKTIKITVLEQLQQFTMFVMPYYAKGSLAQCLKQPLTVSQKHNLIVQAAQLIVNLHQSGWIHGDIKPSNILISDDRFANNDDKPLTLLLTDYALAKRINSSIKDNFDESKGVNNAGTPAYLAPECWQGQSATVQSDIYAFGIMMYEILMGKRAFEINLQSDDPLKEWAIQHCQQLVPTLPNQYQRYQNIIDKALTKRMERRYIDMEEVLEYLKNL